MQRFRTSNSTRVRNGILLQVDLSLSWHALQSSRFRYILDSSNDARWKHLLNFVSHYCDLLKFDTRPIPFFDDKYYSSGSFTYYKFSGAKLQTPYYILAVDQTDSPIFWPLAIHEIGHCWLSTKDLVEQICGDSRAEYSRIPIDTTASRIEEAACDVIATRLAGPAYPYAFINKLWIQLSLQESDGYPKNRFRIECMARVLQKQGFVLEAADIQEFGDQNLGSWQDEAISWSVEPLLERTESIHTINANAIETIADKVLSQPKLIIEDGADLSASLYGLWRVVDASRSENICQTIDSISELFLKKLEGSTKTSDAHTKLVS